MSKKIKVNFTMPVETKELLDEINDATIPNKPTSRSEIVEKILNFDDEAVKIFFEIYKYKNQKKIEQQRYLDLDGGGLIFSKDLMESIISNLNLEKLDSNKSSIEVKNDNANATEKRFVYHEKVLYTLNKKIETTNNELENKIEKLSNLFTQEMEKIEKLAIGLGASNASLHESSAKKAIISDQELLDAIAEIVLKKLKDKK